MGWACDVCTVVNESDAFLCCKLCGSERNTGPAPKKREAPDVSALDAAAAAPKRMKTSPLDALVRAPASDRQPPWCASVCAVGDKARCAALLKRHGVVVFRDVASRRDVEALESDFWDWLEREHPTVDRNKPATHAPRVWSELGYANTGVITAGSIGQSALMWRARQLPGVVNAWRTVWGLDATEPAATTTQLLASFDGCGVWRNPLHPCHAGNATRTSQAWYHLDQNAATQPDFVGYQGALTVFGADGKTGSTVVIPGSHKDFAANCKRGGKAPRGAFVRMSGAGDAAYCRARAVQVAPLGPGDLVVWDSRVVHCSNGASRSLSTGDVRRARGLGESAPLPSLLRLVCYVAMVPRSRAKPGHVDERRRAVFRGATAGHDPLKSRRGDVSKSFEAPRRDDALFRLV